MGLQNFYKYTNKTKQISLQICKYFISSYIENKVKTEYI